VLQYSIFFSLTAVGQEGDDPGADAGGSIYESQDSGER
jgi:hypothetical protein